MDAELLRPYIDWYKANFVSIFKNHEGYKWESIQTFQSSYTPDKKNYPTIIKSSFRKSKNLLNSGKVFSLGMMLGIINFSLDNPKIKPSGLDLFYDLLEGIKSNESRASLLEKISYFREHIRHYVHTYISGTFNDYQDLHAVSVYLSHRYPDSYYIFKAKVFNQFNRLIGNEFPYKWGSDENYLSYLDLCDELNAILRREIELDDGFRLAIQYAIHLSANNYPDPEYHVLTQDFIYSVVAYYGIDMTGRYKEQMKSKNLAPNIVYVKAEDLTASERVPLAVSDKKSPSKIDYVLKQKENTQLGKAGEKWVFECEKKRLIAAGRKDLAKEVDWVAQYDDSKGYDILSFDNEGKEVYIEVKTTNGGASSPFFISALEMAISKANPDKYRIYRVYDFLNTPKIRVIVGDVSLLNPQPTSYVVYTE